jgi:hypothetical protein
MLRFSQRHEFEVQQIANDGATQPSTLTVSPLGVDLVGPLKSAFYNFFVLAGVANLDSDMLEFAQKPGVTLTICEELGQERTLHFYCAKPEALLECVAQQQARLTLRQDIQAHKQQLPLRVVFERFSHSQGAVCLDQLDGLMQARILSIPSGF